MGWLDAIAGFVRSVANTVADAVEGAANTVGEAVSDLAETVQKGIGDFFDWVGGAFDWLGGPVAWVWKRACHAFGVFLGGAFGAAAVLIKGLCNIAGGLIGGSIRLLAGVITFNGATIWRGVCDIFFPYAGFALEFIGESIAFAQGSTMLVTERPLNDREEQEMRRLFRDSLAYYNIRIVDDWGGVAAVTGGNSFTVGNRIYLKDTSMKVLAHECVHVWQFQHFGARYMPDSIWAKAVGPGYDWHDEVTSGKTHWIDFNPEAQGAFIENLWVAGLRKRGGVSEGSRDTGAFFDADPPQIVGYFAESKKDLSGDQDWSAMAQEAVDAIRSRKSVRLSQFL